jgi:hypothetical protein
MEKQMRAERDRRAAILNAEGVKQSQILTAEGDRQSAILRAEGQAQSAILRAQGEARAIQEVFAAIHKADPDPKLLAYQYLQMLPQIAQGASNKVWIVPTELTQALGGIGQALGGNTGGLANIIGNGAGDRQNGRHAEDAEGPAPALDFGDSALEDPRTALDRARAEAADAVADAEGESRRSGGMLPGTGAALPER